MPFVPSPVLLLGSLVAAIAVFLSGLAIGVRWEKGKQAADVVTVQEQVIDDANRAVRIEAERALAAAKKEADARVRAAGIRRKGEIDALSKASINCNWDSISFGLLVESINSANDTEATSKLLPKSVPASLPAP